MDCCGRETSVHFASHDCVRRNALLMPPRYPRPAQQPDLSTIPPRTAEPLELEPKMLVAPPFIAGNVNMFVSFSGAGACFPVWHFPEAQGSRWRDVIKRALQKEPEGLAGEGEFNSSKGRTRAL